MGLKTTTFKLSELAPDPFLRMDFDYLVITKDLNILREVPRLKELIINLHTGQPISREDYYLDGNTDYIHLVVRNIKDGELDLTNPIYIKDDKGMELEGFQITKDDIIIAISAKCGASFLYDQPISNIQLTLSHYLVKLQINTTPIAKRLLVYYLNSPIMQKYFRSAETGKTQKNLSKYYIKELPLLLTTDPIKQENIINNITPIEKKIKELRDLITPDNQIINEIFCSYFKWDISIFNSLKILNTINIPFSSFNNNIDTRFSFKFHNRAGQYVSKILYAQTNKRIKDFISEDITLGKSISPNDYDESGSQFYLSMADIKSWYFNTDDAKMVSESYFNCNTNKHISINDIILARSGEGTIGKVALIEKEENEAVFSDFTMRIRLSNYNHLFAYYYFRTDFFQYMIYTHKKGLGNNTNIFPSQIREFPLPNLSQSQQENIVEKIKTELANQLVIEDKIKQKKDEINKIIETSIENYG